MNKLSIETGTGTQKTLNYLFLIALGITFIFIIRDGSIIEDVFFPIFTMSILFTAGNIWTLNYIGKKISN